MNKCALIVLSMALCSITHAEWFQVKSVTGYNQITAFRPNEPNNEVKIRIKNLENIEDIQNDRQKVLLSGMSAQELAKSTLEGQLVRVENLVEDSGTYVGDVYLSYEQVVRGYLKQKMVGHTVAPDIKNKVVQIAKQMLKDLDSTDVCENDKLILEAQKKAQMRKTHFAGNGSVLDKESSTWLKEQAEQGYFTYDSYYANTYLKGIFVYEALDWFKDVGQFLPENIQKIYVGWLASYQNAQPKAARDLEVKIRDMTVRYELYQNFIFDN